VSQELQAVLLVEEDSPASLVAALELDEPQA